MFDKHFQIIEKNEDKSRFVCNHCQSIFKGHLLKNNCRHHLRVFLIYVDLQLYTTYTYEVCFFLQLKHGKIYENYLKEIKLHKKAKAVKKKEIRMSEKRGQAIDNEVKPQPERRRGNSQTQNDEEISTVSTESVDSIDKIRGRPVNVVAQDNMVEPTSSITFEHIDVNINQNDKSETDLNENSKGETFRMKDDEVATTSNENSTKIEFTKDFQRVLFTDYYRIIEKIGGKVNAECKTCKLVVNDWIAIGASARHHIRVCVTL